MNIADRTYSGTWKKDLRLYVHVPFCVKKCNYCDFLSAPAGDKEINDYFNALYKEIESFAGRTGDYIVSSVYIGGGTPSCVDSEKIVRILDELKKVFRFRNHGYAIDEYGNFEEPEITIEINPGTVGSHGISSKKLTDYKNAGINRISFGLQSTHDHELKLLGRIHTYSQFEENYYLAREIGFKNINIDLMSALPGQSFESWKDTLTKIASLKPEHISAYSLIIEEGTPFYERFGPEGPDRDKLPPEDLDIEMYMKTKEILSSYGYERYEISNYAQKGYECRHNLAYWEPEEYLGLGLGSASLINNTRFHNTYDLREYIDKISGKETCCPNPETSKQYKTQKDVYIQNDSIMGDLFGIRKDVTFLSKSERMEEFMFLGLRKTRGVSKVKFFEKFGVTVDDVYYNVLRKLESQGLINMCNDRIWLTDYGINISNRVLAEFLFD